MFCLYLVHSAESYGYVWSPEHPNIDTPSQNNTCFSYMKIVRYIWSKPAQKARYIHMYLLFHILTARTKIGEPCINMHQWPGLIVEVIEDIQMYLRIHYHAKASTPPHPPPHSHPHHHHHHHHHQCHSLTHSGLVPYGEIDLGQL